MAPFPVVTVTYSLAVVRQSDSQVQPLPHATNISFSETINDMPALKFDYPHNGLNRTYLTDQPGIAEVILYKNDLEKDNSRFYLDEYEIDQSFPEGTSTLWTFAGRGVISRFEYTKIYPTIPTLSDSVPTVKPINTRVFPNHTPRAMLVQLGAEANTRAGLAFDPMSWSGAVGSTDADGHTWPSTTLTYNTSVGADLWSVLKKLADSGFINFRTYQKTVKLMIPNSPYFMDLSSTVILRNGRDIEIGGKYKKSYRSSISACLVEGAVSTFYDRRNTLMEGQIGWRREGYVANQSLISTDASHFLPIATAAIGTEVSTEQRISLAPTSLYTPGMDFRVGEIIGYANHPNLEPSLYSTSVARYVVGYAVQVNDQGRASKIDLILQQRFKSNQELTSNALAEIESNASTPVRGPISTTLTAADVSTSSTTFTDTANVLSQTFVVPASGKVEITIGSDCYNSSNAYCYNSFRISGGDTIAAGGNTSTYFYSAGGQADKRHASFIVTGLTPGASNAVTLQHRVSSGTGTFQLRRVDVKPLSS